MKKLVDLNDGGLLQRGVFPSIADNQPDLWKVAKNVEFRDRRAVKAAGYNVLAASLAPVTAITQAFFDQTRRIYYAESGSLYSYENGTVLRIGSGFVSAGRWSIEPYGTWLLATDGENPVQVWKNGAADTMADLADVRRDKARLIKKHKNHVLIYWDQSVDWSSESNPELWEPAVDNSAGGQYLRDIDSDIIAAQPIGENFAIYTSDKLVLQQYIGAPFYFSFEAVIDGVGAVSDAGIIPVGNKNYGMSSKGFFVTDAISFQYIDNPQINDWAMSQFEPNNGAQVVGLHDEQNSSVKWWFPCKDGMTRGVVYQYENPAWGILEQPVRAASSKQVFPYAIIGTDEGFGFLTGSNLGNDPMLTELLTFPLDAGERENYKQWDMVRVSGDIAGLEVRFGLSVTPEEEPEWLPWGDLEYENYVDREAVFLHVEFRSMELDVNWRISGFALHGEVTAYL